MASVFSVSDATLVFESNLPLQEKQNIVVHKRHAVPSNALFLRKRFIVILCLFD
jgi:hypothetical protein